MDHDRLFKQLLQTFFVEFVELFLPEIDAYLDRASIEFLDKEIFTDVISGERHEVDLVVKARFRGRDTFFLIHIENESSARGTISKRMFQYFARLYEKLDLAIYPVVLCSYDEPKVAAPDEHRIEFPDREVLRFSYRVIQLNRLDWRAFVKKPNPVAAALMAKMRIPVEDRPYVMLECVRMIATLKLSPAKQSLIHGFMSSYLRLSAAEMQVYNREVRQIESPDRETVMEYISQWEEIGEARGIAIGEARGEARGEAKILLRQLRRRFEGLAPDIEARISSLLSPKLESLADAILDFRELADLERWLSSQS
jgi:hypothetical protein